MAETRPKRTPTVVLKDIGAEARAYRDRRMPVPFGLTGSTIAPPPKPFPEKVPLCEGREEGEMDLPRLPPCRVLREGCSKAWYKFPDLLKANSVNEWIEDVRHWVQCSIEAGYSLVPVFSSDDKKGFWSWLY